MVVLWTVVKRLLWGIPLVFIVATVSFFLVQLTPGSPAAAVLGTQATPASIAKFDAQLGLDRPLIVQYGEYLGQLVTLNFGHSWLSGDSVGSLIAVRLPVTLTLAVAATLVALILGILIGTISAVRGGWLDRILTSLSGIGLALPNFWLAAILVLVFSVTLSLVPATGYVQLADDPAQWLNHLLLPVITLVVAMVASFARQTRSGMLEQLSSDYVRTLRGTGTRESSVIWRHALRNATGPVVTTAGILFVGVLGGAVVIEQVFALPGIGQAVVQAASTHDEPVVLGIVVFSAIVVLIVNIVIDLVAMLLNPKARLS